MKTSRGKNALANEQSPYLLQHADNPVGWYPWGEEAFSKAKAERKPIFLSIGYSTCHWCHVMERESFENEQVADLLNEYFISIKVDREERPDIDAYYMTVCQILTGGGGWPLTIVMTPDKEPFFAGTYIPKNGFLNRPGMLDLIPALHEAWTNRKSDVFDSISTIMEAVKKAIAPGQNGTGIDGKDHAAAYKHFGHAFDGAHGGFSSAPKFPSPHNLIFLLRYWHRTDDKAAIEMVESTLTHMRDGGIYDHVGFGFHRYSTDSQWRLPHFEKMLYDQAMMSWAYLEAFQATGKSSFGDTASEVLTYVLRDLQSPEGGFYTAEDADSEGTEGMFYLWSSGDLRTALGTDYDAVASAFCVEDGGNYTEEAGHSKTGLNIFSRSDSPLPPNWEEVRARLFSIREKRVHPFKDDKILTGWNGLMISALSKGGIVLKNSAYTDAAGGAADFILEHMADSGGELLHQFRKGTAGIAGYLDDYAFFVQGLIDLYQASFEIRYLSEAIRLTDSMIELFVDAENGGFFSTAVRTASLPYRQKESADSALPSGNSAAFGNLIRLSLLTGNTNYLEHAVNTGKAFSDFITRYPQGNAMMLGWNELLLKGSVEIILSGEPGSDDLKALVEAARLVYAPEALVLVKSSDTANLLETAAPFTKEYEAIDGKATAYVCRNFSCNLPTHEADMMVKQITAAE